MVDKRKAELAAYAVAAFVLVFLVLHLLQRDSGGSRGGTAASPGSPPAQPISLSTATVEQLDTLDGIGPTLAARIVQYRDAHGGFKSVDELRQVSGIGDKRFAALRKAVQP